MERQISGTDEVDTEDVVRELKKRTEDLKKGMDRPAPKNPGIIRVLTDEIEEIEDRKREISENVLKLKEARGEIQEVSKELDDLEGSLKLKKETLNRTRQFVRAKERKDALSQSLDKISADLEKLSQAEEKIGKLGPDLDRQKNSLKQKEGDLERCRRAKKVKADKESWEKELAKKINVQGEAKKTLQDIEELKKKLAGIPSLSFQILKDLKKTKNDIFLLDRSTAERAMLLKINWDARVPFSLKTEDGLIKEGMSEPNEVIEERARKEIFIDIKGIAKITVSAQDKNLEEDLKKLKVNKEFLKEKLGQYGCNSLEELDAIYVQRERIEKDIGDREFKLKVRLGSETWETLDKEIKGLKIKVEEIEQHLDELKDFIISDENFEVKEGEVLFLRENVRSLEAEINENQGTLKAFNKENLVKEKKDLAREIYVADTLLDDLKNFGASGEELMQRETEMEKVEESVSKHKIEKRTLENILKDDRYGQEDIVGLEERIDLLKKRLERMRLRLAAYETIGEVLSEARQKVIEEVFGDIDNKIGEYFSVITAGKYDKVSLSRDDFRLTVYNDDKGGWIDPDTVELSAGARDQLYLAARLAMADSVTEANYLPIILDDPLVHFDEKRRLNAINLLKMVAKSRQVLVFSCHDYYDNDVDQKIELSS